MFRRCLTELAGPVFESDGLTSVLFVVPHGEHTPVRGFVLSPFLWRKHNMQTKSLPAILGGSGRRVASEVAANTRIACVLLKSAPAVAQMLFARAQRRAVSHG